MSYILDALKKAQAERQLGSAPTLHGQSLQPGAGTPPRERRIALWAALTVLGIGALVFAAMQWRGRAVAAAPAQPVVVAAAPAPAVVQAPAPVPAPVAQAAAPLFAPAPAPATVRAAPKPAPDIKQAAAPAKTQTSARAEAPSAPAAPETPAMRYPSVRELPDAIARELPRIAIGGYIYSSNPADRLLLIDKVLRHEGEEVAPGLTLEKLQPKAAVMNYRGYRYTVPY